MPKTEEPARQIIDLDVREVSLVDRAANLRQFLVVKKLEEEISMGAFVKRSEDMTKDLEKKKVEKAEMEEEEKKKAAEEEEKKKAAEEEEEEKKKAAEEEEAKRKAAEEGGGEGAPKEPEEKAVNPSAIAAMLTKLEGAPKEAVEQLVSWAESQAKEGEDGGEEKSLLKALGNGVQVAVMQDGTVVVGGQTVQKSKNFTSARTNTLKDVALQLMKLIGDVDEKAMKDMLGTIKEFPTGKSPASAVRPVGTQKSLESLEEVIKQLQGKIEKLENARPVSKSVENDGGTDKEKPVEKGLWGNVL